MSYLGILKKKKRWKERHLRAVTHSGCLWPHASLLAPIGLTRGRQALWPHYSLQSLLLAILGRADVWATASPSLSLKTQSSFCLKFHLLLSHVVVDNPGGWHRGPAAAEGGRQAQSTLPFTGNRTQASECPRSNVQIAVMSRVKPLLQAQYLANTGDCSRQCCGVHPSTQSDICSVNSKCVRSMTLRGLSVLQTCGSRGENGCHSKYLHRKTGLEAHTQWTDTHGSPKKSLCTDFTLFNTDFGFVESKCRHLFTSQPWICLFLDIHIYIYFFFSFSSFLP
uniref:Uncharacterized protein n=1 Tax=Piliocolobus tephrosceles TaxID=591936 RepID=A0A8C9GE11_9PRIM